MIVPFPPGGVADITGRPVAHVMNKPGADGYAVSADGPQ